MMSDSSWESFSSTYKTPKQEIKMEESHDALNLMKKAVVVLTRLPEYRVSSLRPPTPQQFYSEDESLSNSDSDMQWIADSDSSDSDHPASNKKLKTEISTENATAEEPAPQTSDNKNKETAPAIVSAAFSSCPSEITKIRPNLPEEEVKVDMMVLARKKSMRWQRGKILEMASKEDGKMKYKVAFDENGKSLVSGHHIAFDTPLKLDQLYVGARVVVGSKDNNLLFCPGILAELPSRKNRSRFLVFLDDHKPLYVGLSSLHLVCRPLENVLDDVPDSRHMSFMTKYLKDWPFIHLTQYKVGHILNAELNGVQQKCEVQTIDSSLMEVVFQHNQKKEWIYRGSMRLEHMTRFLEVQKTGKQKDYSSYLLF